MNIQLNVGVELPANAISPTRWSIFALWQHSSEEKDRSYTQRTEIVTPSGEQFALTSTVFSIREEDDLQSKNSMEFFGLPINKEGFMRIRVWLDEVPDASGEYSFLVKYKFEEKHNDAPVTS